MGHPTVASRGVALIMVGAFCFSLAPILARSVEGYSTAAIAFYRALFTGLTFLAASAISPAQRAGLRNGKLNGRELLLLLALGLCMGLTSLFYTYAYLHTTVARAVLLNYTAPIYVALLGPWLLKETRPRHFWAAAPLGLAGIVLIADPSQVFDSQSGQAAGNLAGAASGLTFAAVFILGRYLSTRVSPTGRTLAGAMVMTLMFLPWGVSVPAELFWRNLPWVAGLGFFAMALPYFFIFSGQKYVSAQVGSMVALFEPVCGIAIGYLIYAETLSVAGMVGAGAVLVGILLSSLE
jgi:drug/metabolite transporter (DMT)-like permease